MQHHYAPINRTEIIPVDKAIDRVLAKPLTVLRTNPPLSNSAVDGYGFATRSLTRSKMLKLEDGQLEPGAVVDRAIPPDAAIRILTGSPIPEGVDTVLIQEHAKVEKGCLIVEKSPEAGCNIRVAGEDVRAGDQLLPRGHKILASDLATLMAAGVSEVEVYSRLRVAVLSTGNELVFPGASAQSHQIIDSNRPMLLAMIAKWGYEPIDLGSAQDVQAQVRSKLDSGSHRADAILTSGGASAGNRDYISSILSSKGKLHFWRLAVKPGRPLVFADWRQTPVLGLPGNPVAAFVCALVFGFSFLRLRAGEIDTKPLGYMVPAAFAKRKKPARREYWRARINDAGEVEIFRSEGSGLTTSLLWSDGLVEVGEATTIVNPGDLVRYLPYSSFGQ